MTEGIRVLNSNIVNANAGEEWPELPDSFFLSIYPADAHPQRAGGIRISTVDFVMVSRTILASMGSRSLPPTLVGDIHGRTSRWRSCSAAFMLYCVGDRIPYSFVSKNSPGGRILPRTKTTTGGTGFDSLTPGAVPLFTDIDPAAHA